jgi:aspartate aminotransferase-like enzyme
MSKVYIPVFFTVVVGSKLSSDKYFRIGHMGISVVDPSRDDVNKIIKSLEEALEEVKESKAKQHF